MPQKCHPHGGEPVQCDGGGGLGFVWEIKKRIKIFCWSSYRDIGIRRIIHYLVCVAID